MSKKEHIHKVKRKTYPSGNSIYFCILDNCHFKIECDLYLGKTTLCNICNNPFTVDEYTIKLKRPHCNNCSKIKVSNPDGTKSFVRKNFSAPVLSGVAANTITDLKERLQTSIQRSLTANEEDI